MNSKLFLPDEKMHTGHRSRMRSKFLNHGARIFDTYELLEMLLYYSVPYKDTNPIAKRLLEAFGSLDGVLSASREELMAVPGIGEATAELISSIDAVSDALFLGERKGRRLFNDYSVVGSYFTDILADCKERSVIMLLLDNGMREIATVTVYKDVDYGTAAVKPKAFIDSAILAGASVVIIAHNHPYGPDWHTDAEDATNESVASALVAAGIMVAEMYLISGGRYFSVDRIKRSFIKTGSELDNFRASKRRALAELERGTEVSLGEARSDC